MLRKLYGKLYQLCIWLRYFFFQRRRLQGIALEEVEGIPLIVLPDVFNPTIVPISELFVRVLNSESGLNGVRVLDMGTGTGLFGIAAALRGAEVVALDLNPAAVRCARLNALLNDVSVDVRESDLFQSVEGESFDLVLFNPPFFTGKPKSMLEMAFFSEDAIDRFISGLRMYLNDHGAGLIAVSDTRHMEGFYPALERNGFRWEVVAERRLPSETYSVVRVRPVGL